MVVVVVVVMEKQQTMSNQSTMDLMQFFPKWLLVKSVLIGLIANPVMSAHLYTPRNPANTFPTAHTLPNVSSYIHPSPAAFRIAV